MSFHQDHHPTVAELVASIRSGERTPSELLEQSLDTIERLDSEIEAWVAVAAERAREQAALLTELAQQQKFVGPLHGVPVGVKDIIDVAGLPTRAGSPLTDDAPVEADARVVAMLRAAGAVIVGKTVTTEWACFDPAATRNPLNPAHTPGGSSAGSAAAVAAGMVPLALATQTGGSITRPASYCGACGWKPTYISQLPFQTGVVPVSRHLDHVGAIAGHVADFAPLYVALMVEPDKQEAHQPVKGFAGERGPKLGLLGGYFQQGLDPAMEAAMSATVGRLSTAGATVELVELPPEFETVIARHRTIMAVECASVHRSYFSDYESYFGPNVAALIRAGLAASAVDYCEALDFQENAFRFFMNELASAYDALICPATPAGPPASRDTTGDPRFNAPWSFSGQPTVSFPIGSDGAGMPLAVQLVGPLFADEPLIHTGIWCQQAVEK